MNLDSLKGVACSVAWKLKILGSEDRLCLLFNLLDGEKTVKELGSLSCVAQPSLSQQLTVLRVNQIVSTRRNGKFIYYAIQDPKVEELLRVIQRLVLNSNSDIKNHD
ncbi:metalloregulator ArsR/SmtB family transcription factor [uncultured Aquitalea sp.]|uniref:ArsR/SmtB family transcription factor n=1 Tax=uncultured Aquitalea sp. TaxID=540272 RepID=UPI0025F19A81|nr:metalloregulator ArsR/SmtB family transcription factor [uncultured Aquitalea sp.]